MENRNKRILVAPLNWGLGHSTRCIPIIRALITHGFEPILASDGVALALLKKEFPELIHLELPSYQVEYAKNGKFFMLKLLWNAPTMLVAILKERNIVKKWVEEYQINGIISDNRLGVHSKLVPSVFITHQLNVLTGNSTKITTFLHKNIIRKYAQCWVPDVDARPNLSGKLGHLKKNLHNVKYIGPLSRFEKKTLPIQYKLMVILSGPEPQRGLLEEKLILELQDYTGKILFVKGKIEAEQTLEVKGHITYYNYMNSEQLEQAFNESCKVLCRSGYTTIMDLAKLEKKAFFIPTPGQFEQEYLAKKYKKEGIVPYAKQEKFTIENLYEVDLYKGLEYFTSDLNWKKLFLLFERK